MLKPCTSLTTLGKESAPPVPSMLSEAWASMDICGMTLRHLGMQQGPATLEWG